MDITIVLNQMIQLFLIISLGYLLRKINCIDDLFNEKLSKLVLDVTMPAMIVASVLKTNGTVPLHLPSIIASCIILIIILPLLSYFIVVLLHISREQMGLYLFMMMYPNVGFMGFTVMNSIFGPDAILSTAIINICFNVSLFTVGKSMMSLDSWKQQKFSARNIISPGMVASLGAIVLYGFQIRFPEILTDTLEIVGSMTTPLAMLLIGVTLAKLPAREIWGDYKVYLFSGLIQIILPVGSYPILKFFIPNELIRGITFIILAMPVANSAVLFANEFHKDTSFAAKTIFMSTLMSVVTIPFLVYCFLL